MQQTCCLTVLPSDGASRVKQTHTILHRLKNVSLTSADLATDTQLILQFFNLFHFRAFFFFDIFINNLHQIRLGVYY